MPKKMPDFSERIDKIHQNIGKLKRKLKEDERRWEEAAQQWMTILRKIPDES